MKLTCCVSPPLSAIEQAELTPVHCWNTMMRTATHVRLKFDRLVISDLYPATPRRKLLLALPSWRWG